MLKRNQLHNYQNKVIDFAKKTPHCGLFLSLGAGKTPCTLTVLSDIDHGTTLIVGPIRVMKTVWIQEAQKWEHTKDLEFNQLTGLTPKKRLEKLKQGEGKINLINYIVGCIGNNRKSPKNI